MSNKKKKSYFKLIPDPKYYIPWGVVTTLASLQRRDPSKSGGG